MRHYCLPRQRRGVRRLLADNDFAAVVADTPYAMGPLPASPPPVLVIAHNIETEVWRSLSVKSSGGRLRSWIDKRMVAAWEPRTLRGAQALAACSRRDLDTLETMVRPDTPVAVVPNAVDTGTLQLLPRTAHSRDVLFVGTLEYTPNAEAADFISRELAARLHARGRTAVVAGGDGQSRPGCRFVGRVTELRPLYEDCRAVIVPLFSGSGTRLKILEAMAYGRPVIATAKAVEGLDLTPGVHFLPAESALEFMAQVDALDDDRAWARLVAEGRALVEEHYSWHMAGAAFLDLLDRLLARPPEATP
jgi:glycosyltransferase involved in cell wall biosynthesis